MQPTFPVTHNPEQLCFSTPEGAVLSYTIEDGRHLFDHTEVPPSLRGQGVAAQLARAALDHAAANRWKVVPACSYIELYIRRHPEYAGLVAAE
jgi:predicted GNAT family acetyltransferase